jgi:triacylglycerol lipase
MKNFKNRTTLFSGTNAYWLALCSKLAYETEQEASKKLYELGMRNAIFIDECDTQAIVMSDENKMIISIRGTDSLADAMTDINVSLVQGPGGRVHEGFNIATAHIWKDIMRLIKTRGNRSLWLTGHSLGAGIAAIIAAKLVDQYDEPINGIYTFGMPRTGDKDFAREYNSALGDRTFRFVNNNDIVTRTPFRSMGYRHVGQFMYFDENGNFREDIGWWEKLVDRIHGRIDDIFERGTDGVKDHSMGDYLDRAGKIVG